MNEPDSLDQLSKEELIQEIIELRDRLDRRAGAEQAVTKTAGKSIARFFIGSRLYKSTGTAFTDWVEWMQAGAQKDGWPHQATGNFVAALLARLMRIGFIAVLGATVTSIVLVTQTVILNTQTKQLEAQNQHFERQNTFFAFDQTSKFRDLLFKLPVNSNGDEVRNWEGTSSGRYRWLPPSQSTIDQLVELGLKETETVHKALEPLLTDESRTVAVGAIQVLGKLNVSVSGFQANISKANLTEANLREADLRFAGLEEADLRYADLTGADLTTAILKLANLSGTILAGADLSSADLKEADLSDADLHGANLTNTSLSSNEVLCTAYDLTDIQPDTLLNYVRETCPEKINP